MPRLVSDSDSLGTKFEDTPKGINFEMCILVPKLLLNRCILSLSAAGFHVFGVDKKSKKSTGKKRKPSNKQRFRMFDNLFSSDSDDPDNQQQTTPLDVDFKRDQANSAISNGCRPSRSQPSATVTRAEMLHSNSDTDTDRDVLKVNKGILNGAWSPATTGMGMLSKDLECPALDISAITTVPDTPPPRNDTDNAASKPCGNEAICVGSSSDTESLESLKDRTLYHTAEGSEHDAAVLFESPSSATASSTTTTTTIQQQPRIRHASDTISTLGDTDSGKQSSTREPSAAIPADDSSASPIITAQPRRQRPLTVSDDELLVHYSMPAASTSSTTYTPHRSPFRQRPVREGSSFCNFVIDSDVSDQRQRRPGSSVFGVVTPSDEELLEVCSRAESAIKRNDPDAASPRQTTSRPPRDASGASSPTSSPIFSRTHFATRRSPRGNSYFSRPTVSGICE